MSAKLRYGCIGAGKISHKKHMGIYSTMEDIELVSVCDANRRVAEDASEKYGIPGVYSDYREMLDKEKLDMISICTPNNAHSSIALEAIDRGIHVHCEKPVGITAAEVSAIKKAADNKNIVFMAGLNFRFSKTASIVKNYIDNDLLGNIYHAKCGWIRRCGIPGKGAWFTAKEKSGGGPLIDLGVHYLDLVMNFMYYPECDTVSAHTYSNFANSSLRIREGYPDNGHGVFDVEDTALGLISLKNNASIFFEFSWASNIEEELRYFQLLGTKGGIYSNNGAVKYFGEMDGKVYDQEVLVDADNKKVEHAHFIECIRTGKKPDITLEQNIRLMAIIEAAYKSAETSAPAKLCQ